RERERETHHTAVFPHSHQKNTDTPQLTEKGPILTENVNMPEFLSATAIPGLIKNGEGKINGRITYARITIRKKKTEVNK
ncbi:MAG: hypothetical protein IKW63_00580, partial [Elusimicrobiaceae bacterium]|nr:hypothetical protein [Elusimicrobiaceae bacterium]